MIRHYEDVKDIKKKLNNYSGRRTNEMLSLWERN